MKWLMLAWTGLIGFWLISTMSGMQLPPPGDDAYAAGWFIGVVLGVMMFFFIWLCGALPIYLLSRMFQSRENRHA